MITICNNFIISDLTNMQQYFELNSAIIYNFKFLVFHILLVIKINIVSVMSCENKNMLKQEILASTLI